MGVTHTTQGVEVSYDRPYATQTGAGQFFIREVAMVRFLERHSYPVSYTTIESIDADPGQVARARALMDVGHSEYWSARDERAFARARDEGTSLIFISSDTMAWRVRFARATAASSQAGERDHVIVAYKEAVDRDPDRGRPSGLFPSGGAPLVGSAYNGCITPRVRRNGPPTYRYYAWAPSPRLRPSWLFARSGVTASTRIPGIVGYELDQSTPYTPAGHAAGGHERRCAVRGRGRAIAGPRHGGADDAVSGALGSACVRDGNSRLGVRALARSPGLARRPVLARPAGRGDDAQPARARARRTRLRDLCYQGASPCSSRRGG